MQTIIQPKVSVIIPVYNTESYLREMLDSIVNQTLREVEFIAINDGSTDGSLAILNEYAAKDDRLRVISQSNHGLSVTRNVGLDAANGSYIYFMDSDDILELTTLEACYKQCVEHELEVITFDASIFGDGTDLLNEKYYCRVELIRKNVVFEGVDFLNITLSNLSFRSSVCLYMVKKELIDRLNLRFYPGIIHEDQLFTTLLFAQTGRIMYLPFAFFRRRVRANSIMTNRFGWRNIEGYLTVFDELLRHSWSRAQQEAINKHVSVTLNTLLRYVTKGLSLGNKLRFAGICIARYGRFYEGHNLAIFLLR